MTSSNKRYDHPRLGEKLKVQKDYYNFVFSSDIMDWQVGYKLNWDRKHKKNGIE